VGADAAEDLAGELDAGLGERRRELVAGQLPDVLVGDHQRPLADLGTCSPSEASTPRPWM
jgi:hypothetical protein